MNILITGCTGSLGRFLTKICIENNFNVYGLGHSDHKIKMYKLLFPNIKVSSLSLESDFIDKLENILITFKPDIVIHTAAAKYVDLFEENISYGLQINCISVEKMMSLFTKYNIKKVI